MLNIKIKSKIALFLLAGIGLGFFGIQHSFEQFIARAITIHGSFNVNDTAPSYVAGNTYYNVKNITISPSKYPIDITDSSGSRPNLNIDSNSVSMRGNMDIHTTPQDINKSSISIYIPIIHIRNNSQSITIDGHGNYLTISDQNFDNLTAKVLMSKLNNQGEFKISDK